LILIRYAAVTPSSEGRRRGKKPIPQSNKCRVSWCCFFVQCISPRNGFQGTGRVMGYWRRETTPSNYGRSSQARQRGTFQQQQQYVARLPATSDILLLHLSGGRDRNGRTRDGASGGVDDGDGVAGALSHGLVEVGVRRGVVGRIIGIRHRGEEEGGRGMRLVL
jgi:hypothetical protein